MSKELNHLKAQLNAVTELRAWIAGEIAELEAPKVEKWEPKGGEWWIRNSQDAICSDSSTGTRLVGIERETQAKAEAALGRMRTFNRMDAWIDENVDGECPIQVEFLNNTVSVVRYMPESDVLKLEKLVENGVVVL